jgi:hypothetical protein
LKGDIATDINTAKVSAITAATSSADSKAASFKTYIEQKIVDDITTERKVRGEADQKHTQDIVDLNAEVAKVKIDFKGVDDQIRIDFKGADDQLKIDFKGADDQLKIDYVLADTIMQNYGIDLVDTERSARIADVKRLDQKITDTSDTLEGKLTEVDDKIKEDLAKTDAALVAESTTRANKNTEIRNEATVLKSDLQNDTKLAIIASERKSTLALDNQIIRITTNSANIEQNVQGISNHTSRINEVESTLRQRVASLRWQEPIENEYVGTEIKSLPSHWGLNIVGTASYPGRYLNKGNGFIYKYDHDLELWSKEVGYGFAPYEGAAVWNKETNLYKICMYTFKETSPADGNPWWVVFGNSAIAASFIVEDLQDSFVKVSIGEKLLLDESLIVKPVTLNQITKNYISVQFESKAAENFLRQQIPDYHYASTFMSVIYLGSPDTHAEIPNQRIGNWRIRMDGVGLSSELVFEQFDDTLTWKKMNTMSSLN